MEGAGMPSEETEEGGTVALGGQALEIVQRHVGIGRCCHLDKEAGKERREQFGVPRLGRHRVQIAERARGLGEAAALELRQRGAIAGSDGGVRWQLPPSLRYGCGWPLPWEARRPCRRRWSRCAPRRPPWPPPSPRARRAPPAPP